MSNTTKLCMSCMNPVPANATACPNCGYNGTQRNPEVCLPIGYRLFSRYVIGMRKDYDGDSVSYIGYDVSLNTPVEVREFLPVNGCQRNASDNRLLPKVGAELHYKTALSDFSELYKNLAKLTSEEGLIRTTDFFEANGTAYAILEAFDGVTLREFLSLKGGRISFEQSMMLLTPVIDALYSIHKVNLIHRGVSPDTIYINRNGFVKLGGFATSSVRTKGTEVANKLFPGYTAPEQYSTTRFQSFSTDVYALAATFYRCVCGATPQDADQRANYDTLEDAKTLVPELPEYAANAISLGMLLDADARVQSILELKKMLLDEYVAAPKPAPVPAEPLPQPERRPASASGKKKKKKKGRRKSSSGTTAAIVAGCFAAVFLLVFAVWKFVLPNFAQPEDNTPVVTALTAPGYVGLDVTTIAFDNLHFKYQIESTYEADTEENLVVRQEPVEGTEMNDGDTITLYVNKGNYQTMISVVGEYYKNAQDALTSLGIKYKIKEVKDSGYAEGVVIEQSIKSGEEFNVNTRTVELTIAETTANDDEENEFNR
ncbi:MAG: PASTA domain-containing protein [Oscillospiraceae bacterium]|nr:PASTA domain-containing protein [Oscillospiraceae bacterium]